MDKLFNSEVSIITKAEIRYEGTLFQINPQSQTLALKEVRSFGTEGRRPDHEILPNSQSYDILVFKGVDIQELLTVQEYRAKIKKGPTETSIPLVVEQQQPTQEVAQQQPVQKKFQDNRQFDYEEVSEKMNEIEKIKNIAEQKPKYVKGSFFDNLSSNQQKQDRSGQMKNQNQLDTDTFGNFYRQKPNYNQNNGNRNHRGGQQRPQQYQRDRIIYVEKNQEQK